ncbi:GH22142 [Drosophila grimshawi]|uniref:GH22142 n=1 Tax=Drosophila grimshawi TaxID=7222 RepID=B4J4L8_DROGR|nr:GH22142 [Drosophila grimshawi]
MFHHLCLVQWLERSKTCPQGRYKCTMHKIRRVYFNFDTLNVTRIDVGALQEQLSNAKLAIENKEQECIKVKQEMKDLQDTQMKCLETIALLQEKEDYLVCRSTMKIGILKRNAKELRKQNESLKQQVHAMEDDYTNLKAWSVASEQQQSLYKYHNTKLNTELKMTQNDLRREMDSKRKLVELILRGESNEKVKKLLNVYATSKSLGLGTNMVALKREERLPIKSHNMKQSIIRIKESSSTFLNTKSSSVNMAHLLKPHETHQYIAH